MLDDSQLAAKLAAQTAPRVTREQLLGRIAEVTYFQHKTLTLVVLDLDSGFTVTGEGACAAPENFDAEIGRKIAFDNAINKMWALEGYALRLRLHEAEVATA